MTVTYRGIPVDSVHYDRHADRYELYSSEGYIVGELKRVEFLSQPQLRSLRQTNGRHRKSNPQVHRYPAQQSGVAIDWRTFSPITLAGVTFFAFDGPRSEPIAHSGIRAGEIIAPRAWRVEGDRLFSVYQEDEWLPSKPIQGDPRDNKNHGVHAFKDCVSILDYLAGKIFDHRMRSDYERWLQPLIGGSPKLKPEPQFVIGTVAMWGEIVEHERGWRGEFGRIESIDSAYDPEITSQTTIEKLRARYGLSTDQKVRALLNGGVQ